jgi:hypothetical protein
MSDGTETPPTGTDTVAPRQHEGFATGDFIRISSDNVEFRVESYHLFSAR